MSAPLFTPGPWVVESRMSPTDLQRPWVQQAANPAYFTALACGDDPRNAAANAHLIAQAPELYRYLELALGVLDRANVAWGGEPGARAVLAKAGGEQ